MNIKLNGVNLDFEVFEASEAAKLEEAQKNIEASLKELKTAVKSSLAETITSQCEAIFAFFNTVFGDGADRKIFGDSTNLKTALTAYRDFMQAVNEEKESITKLLVFNG
jgi:predicted RNA-binding protein